MGVSPACPSGRSTLLTRQAVSAALILLVGSSLVSVAPGASAGGWDDVSAEPVLTGLDGPIDIALEPDGTIWWNEYYSGNVTSYDPATGTTEVRFHADPIERGVERGMLGLALDPDVADNDRFYVYYTVADPEDPTGGTNRLSAIDGDQETVLLTVPADERHNGGRILFAPDGTMFVSTGDNEEGMPAQDPGSRLGKILHLHPDGQPAEDTVQGYVYSLGHRNVYGLAYDEATDRLFATENNNADRDEINLIKAGSNYGWPHCAGHARYDHEKGKTTDEPCTDPRFEPPIGEFYPDGTAAPTGAAFVGGALYWAAWNQGQIHKMTETSDGWNDTVVHQTSGRINDLEAGPSGQALYYSNWTGIHRLALPQGEQGSHPTQGAGPPSNGTVDREGPGDGTDGVPGLTPGLAVIAALGAALARARR